MESETAKALDALGAALSSHPDISEWTVQSTVGQSTQLFLIGTEPEAVRQVSTELYSVTVHRDHKGGRGQARISLTPADLPSLEALVDQAAFMASLSDNPPYSLPGPAQLPQVALMDENLADRGLSQRLAFSISEQVTGALSTESQVRLSSLEAFLATSEVTLRTSTGVQGAYRASRVTLDLVLVSRGDDGKESEAQETWERRRLSDLDVPRLVREQAAYARDSLNAALPLSGQYPVVIDAEAMQPLFRPILYRASGEAKFSGQTPWETGQQVLIDGEAGTTEGERGDTITLMSDATFPYGTASRPFDDEGLPGRRTVFIEEGTLRAFLANKRNADYLGIAPTGPAGVLVLNTGERAEKDLLDPGKGSILHVVSFSSLQPDAITGDFSAEIRLGYLVTRGGRRPVKGGTVSGNVFSAFGRASLGSEAVFLGTYHGPACARFGNVTVTGGDNVP